MRIKSFCTLFFSFSYILCHERALQNQEKEKQPGALAWQITCSCHLNRHNDYHRYNFVILRRSGWRLSGKPIFMFPIKALLLSSSALREAKPDEDLGDFLQFQTDFKSTITTGVSTNPLNVILFFIFSVILGEHSGIHFDTVVCDAARLSVITNTLKDGWIDWWIGSKLLILSQCSFLNLCGVVYFRLCHQTMRNHVSLLLGWGCFTKAECVGEGFGPCALTAAPWQATTAPCMDPAAGCRATHRWCKNQQCQQLVWEHLRGTSLRDYTLRNTVAEDSAVNHLWAEQEHTDHDEEYICRIYGCSQQTFLFI